MKKIPLKVLLKNMAKRFHGGKLIFDTAGKKAVKMMIKKWVKQAGIKDVDAFFHVNKIEEDVTPWFENAKISSRGYMLGYNEPSVSGSFRLLAKMGDEIMRMQIVRVDF